MQAVEQQQGWINCLALVPHLESPLPVMWWHLLCQGVMKWDPSHLHPLALTVCPWPLQMVKLAQGLDWCRGLRVQGMWHREETQRVKIPTQRQVLHLSTLSRASLTPESCQQKKQGIWCMLNFPLHLHLGMEQEQEELQHWDKCPCLVLSAMLEWNLIPWELKDKGSCLVNLPVLLGLFSHL